MISLRASCAMLALAFLQPSPALAAPAPEIKGVYEITLEGRFSNLSHLWLPEFKDWPEQTIHKLAYEPKPDRIVVDKINENRIAYWASPPERIKVTFWATLWRSEVRLDSVNLAPYQKNGELFRTYTRPGRFVDKIAKQAAMNAVQEEVNPLRKVRNIAAWMKKHPPFSENLFVGICRAAGIPSRLVSGYLGVPGQEKKVLWAEYYLPRYGWLPFWGRSSDPWKIPKNLLTLSKGADIELFPDPEAKKKDAFVAPRLDGGFLGKEALPDTACRLRVYPPFDPLKQFSYAPFHLTVPVPYGWSLTSLSEPRLAFSALMQSGEEKIELRGKRFENPDGLGIKELALKEAEGIPGGQVLSGEHVYLSDLTGYRMDLLDLVGRPEARVYFLKGDRLFWLSYRSTGIFDEEKKTLGGCVGGLEIR